MVFASSTHGVALAALPQHRALPLAPRLCRRSAAQRLLPRSAHGPPHRHCLAARQPSASGGQQGSTGQPVPDQPLEAPAPSHAAPRVSAAASKCLAAFWKVLVAAVLLAFALYYCRYELAWLFVDGPQLLPSAWHGLLAQQLLPCLNKYYAGVWGMPPQEAAAAAAEAAAVQAKNISFKKAVLAVLLILGALFVFFFKAMGGFRAALNELAASKRSG